MQWIVFDVGEVLIKLNTELMIQELASCCSLHPNILHQFYRDDARDFICGRQSENDFYQSLRRLCMKQGIPEDLLPDDTSIENALLAELQEAIEGTTTIVERLQGHCPLACFSNTNAVHWRYIMDTYPVMKHFQKIFTSHELGSMKPEAASYRAVTEALDVPANKIVFIDDKAENIRGARKAGWAAFQFDSPEISEQLLNQIL